MQQKNIRYYSLNQYLREKYGEKVYKLALNGGMTCPNRDGKIDTRGCLFCSAGGSGDFAEDVACDEAIELAKKRLSAKQTGNKFIAYFQAYTNTYASVDYLRNLYMPIIQREDIVGLSIGTRPDCLSEDILDLLEELNQIKPVWVELGLQTIHPQTAKLIRRGYELPCFEKAVKSLHEREIDVITHLILGLPGESKEDMLASVQYLNTQNIQGVKFQLLHVLKNTDLAQLYQEGNFKTLSMEEYIDILMDAIACLSPDIVIHRLTGDGPKNLLIAPKWSENKKYVLNSINQELRKRDITQGCRIKKESR